MILYLDNFVIVGSSFREVQQHTAMVVPLLELVGFKRNQKKSCLVPTQVIPFLSFLIDRLHCRGERGESYENEIHLQEIHFITSNACSPVGKSTGTLESCRLASKLLFTSDTYGFN